jgi:solute carrier family 50 protein (sugar transporter)
MIPLTASALVNLSAQIAPAASILVFLAPMPTILSITKDRSVGSLPLLPYSSMFSSTFLWMIYGVVKQEPILWKTNGVGLIAVLYYLKEFIKYAPPAAPTLPGSVKQHLLACIAVIVATSLTAIGMSSPENLIGSVAVVFCLVMFASPLSALKTVLDTKSSKSIPLPFTIASTANCLLWAVAGKWKLHDPKVYVTNALAFTFGLAQIGLKLIFREGTGSTMSMSDLKELPL